MRYTLANFRFAIIAGFFKVEVTQTKSEMLMALTRQGKEFTR